MIAVAMATGATVLAVGPVSAQDSQIDVTTTDDTVDVAPGDGECADSSGECSLRAAVQEANAAAGDDTIRLADGATYALSLGGADEQLAATGDLDVTSVITIEGQGATVDADGLGDRAFDVLAGASLTVEDLDVTGAQAATTQSGGAFQSAGSLSISDAELSDNIASGTAASGGAIFNAGGQLVVTDSVLRGNTATRAGGGIEANAGTTSLNRVRLVDNETGPTPGNGGGLHLTGAGAVDVSDSVVRGNIASAEGGGLWNSAIGTMTVKRTEVRDNTANGPAADQGGGGLFNDGGSLTIIDSPIEGNQATGALGSGGGILNDGGELEVSLSTISDNTSVRAGGGIEANFNVALNAASTTSLDQVNLRDNQTGPAPGNGGGLHITGLGTVDVSRSQVTGNTATAEGGGLWNSAAGAMTVKDTQLIGNTASGPAADQGGGALFSDGGPLRVERSVIRNNTADGALGSGGGILNNTGDLTVVSTLIANNSSVRAGGGIEANVGATTLKLVTLVRNTTGDSPGNGGGLHLTGAGTVDIDRSSVLGNQAANEGGGLWNSATGTMTVTRSAVVANRAPVGRNVFNDGGTFTLNGDPVPPTP